jgi:hypothetical protein
VHEGDTQVLWWESRGWPIEAREIFAALQSPPQISLATVFHTPPVYDGNLYYQAPAGKCYVRWVWRSPAVWYRLSFSGMVCASWRGNTVGCILYIYSPHHTAYLDGIVSNDTTTFNQILWVLWSILCLNMCTRVFVFLLVVLLRWSALARCSATAPLIIKALVYFKVYLSSVWICLFSSNLKEDISIVV